MCGRYTLKTPAPKLIELFHTPQFPDLTPRYNIAPTQRVLVIRIDPENKRQALLARWGLIPFWAKDVSIGARMINARSETVSEKPAFRQAWKKRRCLIPADGFFEWETVAPRQKQPWLIHMNDELPFAMAGLWECWRIPTDQNGTLSGSPPVPSSHGMSSTGGNNPNGETDSMLISCTILTTQANDDVRPLHDRMPVILQPHQYECWLNEDSSNQQRLDLLQPLPNGSMSRRAVSTAINKVGNEVDFDA
ncbi:MAG: SOS response-associated peptidase [Planctomycetaceae bacterium]